MFVYIYTIFFIELISWFPDYPKDEEEIETDTILVRTAKRHLQYYATLIRLYI